MPRAHRPPAPEENHVVTYYERPLLDRLTGHYTVAWENAGGPQRIRVHNRLTDMEGHPPSLGSLLKAPAVLRTYLQARRHPILPEPLPFLVWDAIRFLARELRPGSRVLELGSGNSTLWFLGRGAWVTSLEHDPTWAEHVREAAAGLGPERAGRLRQHVAAGREAVEIVHDLGDGEFDLALVDCMNAYTYRRDALRAARPKVRRGGWLVLDNSDHPNNWRAVEDMAGYARRRFSGLAPMCPVVCQTSAWRVP